MRNAPGHSRVVLLCSVTRYPGTRVPGIAHKIRLSARECPRVLYELLNPGTRHMVCTGTGDRPGEDDRATGNPSEVCEKRLKIP